MPDSASEILYFGVTNPGDETEWWYASIEGKVYGGWDSKEGVRQELRENGLIT